MPNPGNTEQARAAAVLEVKNTHVSGTNHELQRAVTAGQEIRDMMKTNGPDSSLQKLRERRTSVDQAFVLRKVDKAIGTEFKADGTKKRDSAESARYSEAVKSATLAREFLDKGYDKLSTSDKTKIRAYVEKTISAWPEAQNVLGQVANPADRQLIIEGFINNPAFAGKLRSSLENALNNDESDNLKTAKENFDQAKAEEDARKEALLQVSRAEADTNNQLNDYEITGGKKGKSLKEYESIDVPTLQTEISDFEDQREEKLTDVKFLDNKIKGLAVRDPGNKDLPIHRANLAIAKKELRDLDKELQDRRNKINRRSEIEQEHKNLTQKKQELEQAKSVLIEQLREANRNRLSAQAEYATAKIDRSSLEQDYVDGLRSVFADAAMEHLMSEVQKAEEAEEKIRLEEEQKAKDKKDPGEVGLLDQMGKRWDRAKTTWKGRLTTEPNAMVIKNDLGILLNSGPDVIVREMLEDAGLTTTEIDDKLKDDAFMADARGKVSEKIISKYMRIGKLTDNEAEKILDAVWGNASIDGAIKKNNVLNNKLMELKGAGLARNGGEMVRYLDKHKAKFGLGGLSLAAILLLFFSPVAAAALGGATAIGSAISGAKHLGETA